MLKMVALTNTEEESLAFQEIQDFWKKGSHANEEIQYMESWLS